MTSQRADGEILRVVDLVKHYPVKRSLSVRSGEVVRAVDGVSLSVAAGETLGVVGESGCGKSTLGRTIARLVEPTGGAIWFDGQDITDFSFHQLRTVRRHLQMVFQDPYASLNPRLTVHEILAEPLRIHRASRRQQRDRVPELLELVGLSAPDARRFPHEFSGGQRQRIAIARALALEPKLLILDEPVSALDVSIQAQIVNLLRRLQAELGLAYVFIAHDLAVVQHIADRVAVMYLGRIAESGRKREVFRKSTHPYTQALLSAVPVPNPSLRHTRARIVLQGDVPKPTNPPSGCRFRTRCWKVEAVCAVEEPALIDRFGHGHPSACHFAAPAPEVLPDRSETSGREQTS